MLHIFNDIEPWQWKVMADAHPTHAFDAVFRTARMREHPLARHLENKESAVAAQFTISQLSYWLHSGAKELRPDPEAEQILDLIESPRFHTLTLAGKQPTFAYSWKDPKSSQELAFLITPSEQGPFLGVFSRKNPRTPSQVVAPMSGCWDQLKWDQSYGEVQQHAAGRGEMEADAMRTATRIVKRAINLVASVTEAQDQVRVKVEAKSSSKRRKKRRRKDAKPKPEVYHLERNGLTAWVRRTLVVESRERTAKARGPAGEPRAETRLHSVTGHYKRMWVKSPREGEAVLGVREGSRATLYCVKRAVDGYARGNQVQVRESRVVLT